MNKYKIYFYVYFIVTIENLTIKKSVLCFIDVASDKSWSDETKSRVNSFTLELSPFSTLTAVPGEIVKLYFRVINKHWIPLAYNFHCSDQMGLIRSVLPTR